MKNVSVIINNEKDDIVVRKQLEKIAFDLNGDLCGFTLNEENKVVYIFRFLDTEKITNFKKKCELN